MSWPGTLGLIILLTATILGGFSRLTHGRYTPPSIYAYQLDRAPDDSSTRLVPYVDLALASLLAYGPTRAVAAVLFALLQFSGVVMRVRDDKNAAPDLALTMVAILVGLDRVVGG